MGNPNAGGEQSMDEILASIRRIISEDDDGPAQQAGTAPESQQVQDQPQAASPFATAPLGTGAPTSAAQPSPEAKLDAAIKPLSDLMGEPSLGPAGAQPAPASAPRDPAELFASPKPQAPANEPHLELSRQPEPAFKPERQPKRDSLATALDAASRSEARAPQPAGEATQPAAPADAAKPGMPGAGDRHDKTDQGTSALERLRASMPTLRRPPPSETTGADATPPPPAMRDFSGSPAKSEPQADANAAPVSPEPRAFALMNGAGKDAAPADQLSEPQETSQAATAERPPSEATPAEQTNGAVTPEPADRQPEKPAASAAAPEGGASKTVSASAPATEPAPERAPSTAVAVVPAASTAVKPADETPAPVAAAEVADPQARPATLEDTVAGMLKPMLREWLDDNMPRIVEKMVSEEVSGRVSEAAAPKAVTQDGADAPPSPASDKKDA